MVRKLALATWIQPSDILQGPIIRVTPTLLLVSDATKLPDIYHRYADKSRHYVAAGSYRYIPDHTTA